MGTLWRSAWQLGAGFIFTVATRFKYEASDTTQAHKQLPLFKYGEWEDFAQNSPHGERGALLVSRRRGGEKIWRSNGREAVTCLSSNAFGIVLECLFWSLVFRLERFFRQCV